MYVLEYVSLCGVKHCSRSSVVSSMQLQDSTIFCPSIASPELPASSEFSALLSLSSLHLLGGVDARSSARMMIHRSSSMTASAPADNSNWHCNGCCCRPSAATSARWVRDGLLFEDPSVEAEYVATTSNRGNACVEATVLVCCAVLCALTTVLTWFDVARDGFNSLADAVVAFLWALFVLPGLALSLQGLAVSCGPRCRTCSRTRRRCCE